MENKAKINPKPKRGRPIGSTRSDKEQFQVRLSASQKEKLRQLGGAQWVRDKIDKAKLT